LVPLVIFIYDARSQIHKRGEPLNLTPAKSERLLFVHLRDRKKQEPKIKLQNCEIRILYIFTLTFLQQLPKTNSKALRKLPSTSFAANRVNGVNIIVGRRRELEYSSSGSVRHRG